VNIINRPLIVKIINVRKETENIKTLYFQYPNVIVRPGQFFMIWDFLEEIPISVSYIGGNNLFGISIKGIGDTTRHLISLKEGDMIGIRGPYGKPFNIIKNGRILIIGGGIGIAPLMPLIQELISFKDVKTTCVLGARNVNHIPFLDDLQKVQSKFFELKICTDDGSMGFHGLTSDLIKEILEEEYFDHIYTCGPEIMMVKIVNLSQIKRIPLQASLERIMKCGIGICGHCVLDPQGLRVCKDGPIFSGKELKHIKDFGKFKRGLDGSIQNI